MVSFKFLSVAVFASFAVAAPCAAATNANSDSNGIVCVEANVKRSEDACATSVDAITGKISCLAQAVTQERREVHESALGDFSPRQLKRRAMSLRQRDSNVCVAATDITTGIVNCVDKVVPSKRSTDRCIAQVSVNGKVTCVIPAPGN